MARRQTRSRTPSKKAAAATAQKKTTSKKKGNEKKYLLEDISELYTDPTFIFFFFCALVPAIKDGDIMKFVKFATSPILIFCYVLTYCVWTWAHNGKTVKLTKEQRRACYWYLLNGIVFHFLMDFAVGTLKLEDTLGINYFKMDKRYGCVEKFMQSPGEDCPHESGYIFILTWLEVLDSIACFFLFRAYVQDLPSRAPLELALAVSHAFGTIIFMGSEWFDGMENTPRYYPVSKGLLKAGDEGFDDQIAFYWFAFLGCNPVWIAVPFMYGMKAFNEIVAKM
eukprot:g13703.t1